MSTKGSTVQESVVGDSATTASTVGNHWVALKLNIGGSTLNYFFFNDTATTEIYTWLYEEGLTDPDKPRVTILTEALTPVRPEETLSEIRQRTGELTFIPLR